MQNNQLTRSVKPLIQNCQAPHRFLLLTVAVVLLSCSQRDPYNNVLTEVEKREGWQFLFDGKRLEGWHVYNKGDTASAWKVENGELWCDPSLRTRSDLVTDSTFANFDLQFEWMIEKGGNSGVLVNVQEAPIYPTTVVTGPEFQLLDNENSKAHRGDSTKVAGCLFGVVPYKSAAKPKRHGEWNVSRIVQQAGRLVFTLNGILTCDITLNNYEWNALLAKSSLRSLPDFGKKTDGRIALQNRGAEVRFRALKIKRL